MEEVYGTLLKGLKESNYPTIAELVQAKREYLSKTRSFLKRVGMANVEESEGVMFLNGKLLEYNNDDKVYIGRKNSSFANTFCSQLLQ